MASFSVSELVHERCYGRVASNTDVNTSGATWHVYDTKA